VARIVRTDRELEIPAVDAALRADGHELVLLDEGIAEDKLVEAAREADLVLMCYTPITRRVIEAARKLRAIVKYGVGIDAIDLAAARSRGIPVVNVPDYAEETVAEGAFALMMALARSWPLQRAMDGQGWVGPRASGWGATSPARRSGSWGSGASARASRAWPRPSACACSRTTLT
jgi:D-3-phosphoglycerate dehydrogenase